VTILGKKDSFSRNIILFLGLDIIEKLEVSGSSLGKRSGRFLAKWFKMNWVLENLIQGKSYDIEYMLLDFREQFDHDNFGESKNHPIFRIMSSLRTPLLKL
jgi:hypothetical protein